VSLLVKLDGNFIATGESGGVMPGYPVAIPGRLIGIVDPLKAKPQRRGWLRVAYCGKTRRENLIDR
jgi:hypothetical protein